MKNPPDPSPIDAPDASSSVTSTMEPTSKATLDPKVIAKLMETEQHELLKTLMNHPQLSPPGGIAGIVTTDASMAMGLFLWKVNLKRRTINLNQVQVFQSKFWMRRQELHRVVMHLLKRKEQSGILKNIECDVYSKPILESRTRKGIMRGSTSSIETTSARGQE